MDNNHSRPSQPRAFPIRFLLGQRWTQFSEYPGFRSAHHTFDFNFARRFTLRLNGKSKAWRNNPLLLLKILHVFYWPNLWDGESTREPSLHVDHPGPAGEGVEGPQYHVWEVPGRTRADLYMQNSVGKDILNCSILRVKGTCLFFQW